MYDYVDDEITRLVLIGVSKDAASIEEALDFAAKCFTLDAHDPNVPEDVYDMRAEHFYDARDTWNEQHDVEQTIIALRLFWEV